MNFLILSNSNKDKNYETANQILELLNNAGAYGCLIKEELIGDKKLSEVNLKHLLYSYLIIIGGDGTILRSIHRNDLHIPIVGINKGTKGFLADVELGNIEKVLTDLLANAVKLRNYNLLEGVTSNNFKDYAFNDIVVGREGFARILVTDLYIDNQFVNSFRGDGLLISTSHGSTAYNLSLRGPLVHPSSPVFVITPIAPQFSQFNSLIVPDSSEIKIVIKGRDNREKEALITYDGRENSEILSDNSEVVLKKSNCLVKLVDLKGYNFYDVIRNKL